MIWVVALLVARNYKYYAEIRNSKRADLVTLQSSIILAFIDIAHETRRGRVHIDGMSRQI